LSKVTNSESNVKPHLNGPDSSLVFAYEFVQEVSITIETWARILGDGASLHNEKITRAALHGLRACVISAVQAMAEEKERRPATERQRAAR